MPDILINDIRPRVQVLQGAGENATDTFDFDFPVLAASDLKVAVNATVLDSTDYTVSGVGEPTGGSVQLSVIPADDARVTMWRDMPFQRTTDFTPGADLRAAVLNDELDRTALLLQQTEALVGDSIHRQPYDTDIELVLPTVEDRAGMLLSFDQEGRPETVNAKISGNISSFALIYLGTGNLENQPITRIDGSPLQAGDFYFDTGLESLMAYTGSGWTEAIATADIYLARDGSASMTGPLDMGAQSITNVETINGRDPDADGNLLDTISTNVTALANTADLALVTAWELARIDGLGPKALINTYLDVFSDTTGLDNANSSNVTHKSIPGYITNRSAAIVACDAGVDDTAFDGSGALNGWTISENNTGDVDASAGSVGGNSCISLVSTSPQANSYAHIYKDIGHWGSESLVSMEIRFSDIAALGAFADGGTAVYPALQIYTTHDSGRRSLLSIDGNGRLVKNRGGGVNTYHFLSDAGTFVDDVWYVLTIWQRLDSSNCISDIKIWLDGEKIVDQSEQDYETDSTGSDGETRIGISAESGTGGSYVYLSSVKCGVFPVTSGDVFFNEDWTSGHYTQIVGSSSAGDYAQSFEVSTGNRIIGGGLALYDGTGLGTSNEVVFAIFGDNGDAPDIAAGALAAGTVDISRDMNSAAATCLFTFDIPFTPTPATKYWLVADPETTFRVKYDDAGGYPDGAMRTAGTNDPGSDWCFWIEQDHAVGLDMTLVSNPVTASADPTEIRAIIDLEKVGDAEENTDFSASVSRNGGATWAVANLTPASFPGSPRCVYSGSANIESMGTGTDCVLKLEVTNEKEVRLHRWALQADQPLSL